jgi:hypothetical protein
MSEEQNIPEINLHEESEIINPAIETIPMEVHKHPQHITHSKKWFEYLLEFLMLFLAVFLGFVAENIRENNVEKHHEKQYIKGLIQDLKTDTTLLSRIIKRNLKKQLLLDSLLRMKNTDLSKPENVRRVYSYFGKGSGYPIFTASDATITQLKNGGTLRLVKKNVSDSILSYDLYNKVIVTHNDQYLKVHNEFWNEAYNILDLSVFRDSSFRNQNNFGLLGADIAWKNKNLPAISIDKKDQQRFFGHLFNRGYMIDQKHRADRLISFLEKEYQNE